MVIVDLMVELGKKVLVIFCDVSWYWEVEIVVKVCVLVFGSIDVLVNNVGVIELILYLFEVDFEVWGYVIDVNLKGVFYGMWVVMFVMME